MVPRRKPVAPCAARAFRAVRVPLGALRHHGRLFRFVFPAFCALAGVPVILPLSLTARAAERPAVPAATGEEAVPGLQVQPEHVSIGSDFGGASLTVRARLPEGFQPVVRLRGPGERLVLKRKAKRAGILWMTAGEVVFEDLPNIYQIMSAVPLADLAGPRVLSDLGLSYESLVTSGSPSADWRGELIRLKEQAGLFSITPSGLSSAASTARESLEVSTGVFRLPALTPPGELRLELFGFRNGEGRGFGSAQVTVERSGLTRTVWLLASEHAFLYGCVAVLIAVAAGVLCGWIFQGRGVGGH
jgi:uncharacterized protein (TIGR02186 family)